MTLSTALSPFEAPANDRLKRAFTGYFWASLLLATVLHFLVMALFPDVMAADYSIESEAMEQIEVPVEVEIPPPPDRIVRPAVPILGTDLEIDADVTIDPNTFEENPPTTLPPPPTGRLEQSDVPPFTPYDVRPVLRNPEDYARELRRGYPPAFRDAGIGGRVTLWVYIDERGSVDEVRVHESSGYEQLDAVASKLMSEVARFSPALNRDQRVPVWVQLPVTFEAVR